jgi:signal transduction histidine kinase
MPAEATHPRIRVVDVIVATVLVGFALLGTAPSGADQPEAVEPNSLAYVLAVLSGAVVVVWRRWPVHVFVTTGVVIATYLALGFPFGPILFSGAFSAATLALSRPLRVVVLAGAVDVVVVSMAIIVRDAVIGPLGWFTLFTTVVWSLVWVGLPGAVGVILRTRREATARVREEQARRAVSEERLRMAQEVHDVVGHGLAVIAMQAGAGLHVLDRNPGQVRDVLRAIQATSRESLDGLRAELAHMRGEVDPAHRPHPGLRDVSVLVDRVRSGGLDVRLEMTDHVPAVSDEVGAAAYRIVQEALTNALRHAGSSARAQVRISEVRGQLLLEVTDTGGGRPVAVVEGGGIRGMRDRARRVGGSVEVMPRAAGGVRVTAWLPLQSADGSAQRTAEVRR